ncbi:MAG: amidohydrolase family protein [Chloroflexota bacterium]
MPGSFSSVADLLVNMDYYRITQAVVTHTAAARYDAGTGNSELMDMVTSGERLFPCWVVPAHPLPDGPSGGQIVEQMLARGVRVARMYPPGRSPYTYEPWARSDSFDALNAHRVPLLLTDSDLGKFPDDISQGFSAENVYYLCHTFPDLPVIIVRFNYQNLRLGLQLLAECPNLYLEISYFTTHRGVELVTKKVGAERLIFGTGMPVTNPAVALTSVLYANTSEEEKRLVAVGNFRRLIEHVG